ncbi:MAG TPA: DUF4249 domain-containing protein [Mucilaginibacter sp.]|nr:DUF4249 domain-containing protein [Mucilaginibacter sp.]
MNKWLILFLLIIVSIIGCKQIYQPPAIVAKNNFLVVEGIITGGHDSSFIKLSRSVNVSSKSTGRPELNAIVDIEDDQNNIFPIAETSNGNYGYAGLNIDQTHRYRLRIKTSNGEQYLSDYVPVLNSPPIDSITFDTNGSLTAGQGLDVYVNTHDQTNNTRYYRWEYQETWIFHSFYRSLFASNGDTVTVRDQITQNITNCWSYDTSSNIIIASSARLAKSIIQKGLITFVPSTSEKLESEYSILVRQYALSADAYNYYSILKKNTESLGSIFDPQPSTLTGNIHCINDPGKPAFGYITAGNVSSQRIFVNNNALPAWTATYPYADCHLQFSWNPLHNDTCCLYNLHGLNQVDYYINYNKSHNPNPFIPLTPFNPIGPPDGFFAATKECADCTIRGTNKMPAFWKH